MRPVYIYVLKDPRNGQVRYVGKTIRSVKERLTIHIRQARRENKSHKDRWIMQLLAEDKRPIVEVVEEANEENWQERETHWIMHYYDQQCKLTNATNGGEGLHGHNFSKEHRAKIARAQLGNKRGLGSKHTDEWKEAASKRMRGKKNPNYKRKFSKEYREKLSEGQKGRKHSKETREKMSRAAMGNKRPKGYKQTEEHIQKAVEARRRNKAKRQAKTQP